MDYFTTWVEALKMVNISQDEVIKFIEYQIMYRFGVPKTITTNQNTVFRGVKVVAIAQKFGIKLMHSAPYYAQANG